MRYLVIALAMLCGGCVGPYDCDEDVRQLYPGKKIEVISTSEDPIIYVIDGKFAVECVPKATTRISRARWRPWKDHWCDTLYRGSEEYKTKCVPPKTPEKAP